MQNIKNQKSKWSFLRLILCPLLLSLVTIIVYYPSLNYPFQFDDKPNILKFFDIRNLTFKQLIFSRARWISWWINTIAYKYSKFDPFLYRAINLFFHITAGILLFYFIYFAMRQLQKSFFKDNSFAIASITAALFLLHPVQTQTISYIVQGQLEGLAGLFVIAILLCYLALTKVRNIIGKCLLSCLLIFLTVFSTGTKEIAIVVPFLIILTDWFFISQFNSQDFKKRAIYYLLVSLITFGFYIYYLKPQFFANLFKLKLIAHNNIGNILTQLPSEIITPWKYFISQFKVILHYLFIFIWPFNISVEYDWKLSDSFFSIDSFIPFLVLLSIFSLLIYLYRKNKSQLFIFGLAWFFLVIAPRSSFIPSSELLADYKTYLASIGIFLIFSTGLIKAYCFLINFVSDKLKTKMSHPANSKIGYSITLFAFIIILGFLTYDRNKVWSSSLIFWKNIIDNAPKARALNNYAIELTNCGRCKEAIIFLKRAISLQEYYYADPYTNLANIYAMQGNVEFAIKTLQDSLRINPKQPEAYNNLGSFYLHKLDFENAEKSFSKALELVPHYGKAMMNFCRLYLSKNDPEKALFYINKACNNSDFDQDPMCYEYYGKTNVCLQNYKEAIVGFKKVLEMTTDENLIRETLFNLGNAFYYDKQYKNAIETFHKMIEKFPSDNRGWSNMIETYIILNRFQDALDLIEYAEKEGYYFYGLEIQKAKLYGNLGYVLLAENTLQQFLSKNEDDEKLNYIARQMLEDIKSFKR